VAKINIEFLILIERERFLVTNYDWFEDLPNDCPPSEAEVPNNKIFFRLARSYPPQNEDFYSERKRFPDKKFDADECTARAVSIWSTKDACSKIKKLPVHRDKFVVKVKLGPSNGVILKTGRNKNHYSWWRSTNFDINESCELA